MQEVNPVLCQSRCAAASDSLFILSISSPTLHSVMSTWQLEIRNGGVIIPRKLSNTTNYSFPSPSLQSLLLNIYQHSRAKPTYSSETKQSKGQNQSHFCFHFYKFSPTSCWSGILQIWNSHREKKYSFHLINIHWIHVPCSKLGVGLHD